MLEIESLETAERRALPLRLCGFRRAGVLEPLADPLAQMRLDEVFELRRLLEAVERGLERAVRVAKPPVGEMADRVEIGHLLGAQLAVLHRQPHFGGLHIAKDLRPFLIFVGRPGGFEFVLGSGAVLAAVRPTELVERQRRAQSRPQNEQGEVRLLDVENLRLERVGDTQQAALPEIGLELNLATELELQSLCDRERDPPLGADVPRRRHEYAQPQQKLSSFSRCPRGIARSARMIPAAMIA